MSAKPAGGVTAAMIAALREQTGAGILDAKKALQEAGGDLEAAVTVLRKQGQKVAAAKGDRATREGLVDAYVHTTGKVGAIVAVACETDFVARTDAFKQLAHDIALHIAAASPLYISPADIPADVLEREQGIYADQIDASKPANIRENILKGKLEAYYEQVCLVRQPFVKDDSKTIEQLINEAIQAVGENIQIKGFSRLQL